MSAENPQENNSKKPTFEELLPILDKELKKRAHKWMLKGIAWLDYDDVCQLIRLHVYKKFHLYDPNLPFAHWANRIISRQISNLRRNLYDSHSRPCLKCPENEGTDLCRIYTKQCSNCPIYAKWERTKKRAHDVKLPVTLESHTQEVYDRPSEFNLSDIDIDKVHICMQKVLKPLELKIYNLMFVEGLDEAETAKRMGYTTNEKFRKPGYNTITKIRKIIIVKFKQERENGNIEI